MNPERASDEDPTERIQTGCGNRAPHKRCEVQDTYRKHTESRRPVTVTTKIFSISAEDLFLGISPVLPSFTQGGQLPQPQLTFTFSVTQAVGSSNVHFRYESLMCFRRGG